MTLTWNRLEAFVIIGWLGYLLWAFIYFTDFCYWFQLNHIVIRNCILNDLNPLKSVRACSMTSIWSTLLYVYHLLKRVCFLNLLGTMFHIHYQLRQVGQIFYVIPDVCVFLLVTTVLERSVLKSPTMSVHLSISPFSFISFALAILNNIIGSNKMRIVFPFSLTLLSFYSVLFISVGGLCL